MKELKQQTVPILRALVALAVVLIFILPGETAAETDQGCTEESEMDSLEIVPDGLSAAIDSTCCIGECLRPILNPLPAEWIIEEEDPEEVPELPKST